MKYKTISSNSIAASILIPTSKSYANRAIILAAITKGQKVVADIPEASDVQEMIGVLDSLSLISGSGDGKVEINKSFPEDEVISDSVKEVYLGEGGTTIRFLLTMLSTGSQKYRLKVHPRFKLRPYSEHLKLLKDLGLSISESNDSEVLCDIQGPIQFPLKLMIDCSKTTQIASSFLLLKSKYNLDIELVNLKSSVAYIDMTKEIVNGIEQKKYNVPVDFSSAGYFIALGLFLDKLHLKNVICFDSLQADSQIINILDQIEADYKFENGLIIKPKDNYKPFIVDGSQCLDLVPTLCFIAANIKGTSKIINIKNLLYKETDRLSGIKDILSAFGVIYKSDIDYIEIEGKVSKSKTNKLETASDHRLIMMGSLFLKLNGGGEIFPFAEVSKSFPNFFKLLN
jgi:3-phosphoshikimate 1-carboxyvinyltransferase